MIDNSYEVTGYWAGLLVHFPGIARISANITAEGESLQGDFVLPDIEGDFNHGTFTGTRDGNSVSLELPQEDARAGIRFQGQVVESEQQAMLYGIVFLPGAAIPFGTLTLIRQSSPFAEIRGFWPMLEFMGRELK